jgi:toxin ParE1/3/4
LKTSSPPGVADVRLRQAADADLAAILEYSVAEFGAVAAEAYLRSFDKAFDLLRRHPEAGALRQEIDPPIRCLPHRSHRIFYDVEGNTVWIVRVLHYAMDAQNWLPGDRAD